MLLSYLCIEALIINKIISYKLQLFKINFNTHKKNDFKCYNS